MARANPRASAVPFSKELIFRYYSLGREWFFEQNPSVALRNRHFIGPIPRDQGSYDLLLRGHDDAPIEHVGMLLAR